MPSPILVGDEIYFVSDNGIATSVTDAALKLARNRNTIRIITIAMGRWRS